MAKEKRNPDERHFERMFLAGMIQAGGPDLSRIEAARLLNMRRMETARAAAIKAGKTPAEAENAAQEARLSVQMVKKEINAMIGATQQAKLGGAAVFLDDQIQSVLDDIERTHQLDEQIMLDLARSRAGATVRTKGKAVKNPTNGTSAIEPTEVIRYRREEGSAEAALFGRLQENMRLRQDLRGELRQLNFGQLAIVQGVARPGITDGTFAQAVMNMDNPAEARAAALALLHGWMQELDEATRIPVTGDLLNLQKIRTETLNRSIRMMHDYLRLPQSEVGKGTFNTFEVVWNRAPKRITAGANTEGEGDGDSSGDG